MGLMKILMLLAIIGAAIHFKSQHEVSSTMKTASISPNGFIELPVPGDMEKDMVFVLAAEDCPEEDAQRADSLADELKNHNIPVTRTHSLEFKFKENPGPGF